MNGLIISYIIYIILKLKLEENPIKTKIKFFNWNLILCHVHLNFFNFCTK